MSEESEKDNRIPPEQSTPSEQSTPAQMSSHQNVPRGAINADSISHVGNVVSGIQINIGKISDEGKLRDLLHLASRGELNAASKSPPFILPLSETPFFTSREDELRQLKMLLPSSDNLSTMKVMGMTGTGGMGKSSLACHFATLYRDHFPDGVIGLQIGNKDLITLARHIALLAGEKISHEDRRSASEIMQSVFQHKRMLLILDDVVKSTARSLLPGGKLCAVIVTTRDRGLLGQFGLINDARIDLKRFQPYDTESYFHKRLGKEKVDSEREAIHEIHKLLGGLPLALSIASGTLEFAVFKSYRVSLRDEKKRLSFLHSKNEPDNPELSIRASFNISYRILQHNQRELFASLGVCTSEGFTEQVAQVVSGLSEDEGMQELAYLCRLSLLDLNTKTGWYTLHPLLSLFARERAEELEILHLAEQRHSKYFCEYVQKHRELSPTNMNALEKALDALLLTAHQLNNNLRAANDFYRALEPFLTAKGYWFEALMLIDLFLHVAYEQHDLHSITHFLLQRGQFLGLKGEFDAAEQVLLESKNTAWMIKDNRQHKHSLAMVLNALGIVCQRRGQYDQAASYFVQCLRLEEEIGDLRGQSRVLTSLAGILQRQGKYNEAEEAADKSYQLRFKSDNKLGEAMSLNSQGRVYLKQHKYDEAEKVFKQSYTLRLQLDDKFGQAMVQTSFGTLYKQKRDYNKAVEAFQRALAIEEEIGHLRGQAMVLTSLIIVYGRLRRYDKAEDAFQRSLDIEEKLGNTFGQAMIWQSMGTVYRWQHKYDEAGNAFEQSYNLRKTSNDENGKAMALKSWGEVLLDQHEYLQAMEKLRESFAISEVLKAGNDLGAVTVLLVRVCERLGKIEDARDYCRRALSIAPDDRKVQSLLQRLL